MSAPSAKKVISQARKRTTDSEGNRVFRSINRSTRSNYAGNGAAGRGSLLIFPSRSRRRIAFNFPPSSKNKHVRYIQVSKMMIDASAR
jgi:hypothetical protein